MAALIGGRVTSSVAVVIAALNLTVGGLFMVRRAPLAVATLRDGALCAGSVAMGGVALKLAPPFDSWPLVAEASFVVAGVLAIGSLLALGDCFAVFPSLRGVVSRGPYAFVRHPVYLFETVMVLAASLAAWLGAASAGRAALALLPLVVGVALLALRIVIEERLLAETEAYRAYRARVRWRLLPGIW